MIRQEKGSITPNHFIFCVACFILSSPLVQAFYISIIKQESWIAIIAGFLAFIPVLLLYFSLIKSFPQKNLIQINDLVFGKTGKAVSLLYIWFFLTIGSLNIRDAVSFVSINILPETPPVVIGITFIAVCAWSARSGFETLVRHVMFFIFISFLLIISSTLISINNMNMENLLPVFSQEFAEYARASHVVAAIPIGEIFIFLLFIPFVTGKHADIKKAYFFGALIGLAGILIIFLRDILVLGDAITIAQYPSFETQRLIDVEEFFTRLEIFYALAIIIMLFYKTSVIIYAASLGISQVFNLSGFKHITISIGAIALIYSFFVFETTAENLEWGVDTASIFSTLFQAVIPAITIIVAKIIKRSGA